MALVCVATVTAALQSGNIADASDDVRRTIAQLRHVVTSIGEAERAVEQAWPSREKDTENEQPIPPKVERIHSHISRLKKQQEILTLRIQGSLSPLSSNAYLSLENVTAKPIDLGPLMEALTNPNDPEFLEAIAPVVGAASGQGPTITEAFLRGVEAIDPLPNRLITALGRIHSKRVSLFLLQRGLHKQSVPLLKAAGKSGFPTVIGRLIQAADARKKPFVAAALKTLNRLSPPKDYTPALWKTVYDAALHSRSTRVRSAVLVYLSQMGNPESAELFREIYFGAQELNLKLAAIGGLGNLGAAQGKFLLVEALQVSDSSLRNTLLYALGATKYRPAVPHLLDCLVEPGVQLTARRALTLIAGEDLGREHGLWLRWWRRQPDSGASKDPDS